MKEDLIENTLINYLVEREGYERIYFHSKNEIFENIKNKLNILNKETLKKNNTEITYDDILNLLKRLRNKNVYEKAKALRDEQEIIRYDEKNIKNIFTIKLIDERNWCSNQFQITNQLVIEKTDGTNIRTDVTILINGFPLTHIELKNPEESLESAYGQIDRYKKEVFRDELFGLFDFVQIFIISNNSFTKYFVNNNKLGGYQQSVFLWTDSENNRINRLVNIDSNEITFSQTFLNKCHLAKMITNYIVIKSTKEELVVMRPYQVYAVKEIEETVKKSKGGFVWHTTGSGKTLTSFKTSQVLKNIADVDKILFVVDRRDLDEQTIKEFNAFEENSVSRLNNTSQLERKLESDDVKDKLIVTTLQKLDRALGKKSLLQKIKNKKIVLIFDECHRSQFGKTNKTIKANLVNSIMIGFTGTPIFDVNAPADGQTTKHVFGDCLHSYMISNAIADGNVLRLAVEMRDVEVKNGNNDNLTSYEEPARYKSIVEDILNTYDKATQQRKFNAMFSVSSQESLKQYYEQFKIQQEGFSDKKKIKVATIFSFQQNEATDYDETSILDMNPNEKLLPNELSSRDFLDRCIQDYNKIFNTNFNLKNGDFQNYYTDVAKRVKEREIDLILVVNIFTTGFDAPTLNTLFLDKNVDYHNLIQVFSRTNRIAREKSIGNVISYRNIKTNMDNALKLFSDKNAKASSIYVSEEKLVEDLIQAINELRQNFPKYDDANKGSEKTKKDFVTLMNNLIRARNSLSIFKDSYDKAVNQAGIKEVNIEDYISTYNEIKSSVVKEVSNKVDSNQLTLELFVDIRIIHQDEVNFDYINKINKINNTPFENREDLITKAKRELDSSDLEDCRKYIIRLMLDYLKNNEDDIKNYTELEKIVIKNKINELFSNDIENGLKWSDVLDFDDLITIAKRNEIKNTEIMNIIKTLKNKKEHSLKISKNINNFNSKFYFLRLCDAFSLIGY